MTDYHHDAAGTCTQVAIAHGCKLWFFQRNSGETCVEVLRQGDVL
jgi:hypothetical protein